MIFSKKSAAAFLRISARAKLADLHAVMMDEQGRLCVSDGCILIRLFFEADLYPDGLPAPLPRLPVTLDRAADQASNAAGVLVASARRADYHGGAPILPDNIRQFASFAKKQGYKYPLYPVGRAYVNPSLLADVLDVVPDARFYGDPKNSLQSLYFLGSRADGVLCPIRPVVAQIPAALELLATWRGEKTPLADELRAAEEAKKDEEAYRARLAAQQAERAEKLRQQNAEMEEERRQQEEAEAAYEAEKAREHAEALADLRRKLQSRRDAEIAVDGELLAELMETCGVSVPGRVKGWIRQKLRSVTISAEGHMCAYRFARARKGERGSDAVYTYVDRLLGKLAPADASDVPAAPVSADACPAMHDLLALSAGTLSTLARQKNLPNSEKYSVLEAFHEKIVQAAQTLDVLQFENWQQLFEAAYSVVFPAPASEQNVPQSENQPQMVGSACHMVYCTGPNPLGEQKTMDFPSLAACREWIAAHRSADLAHSCGYTVYAGSHDQVLRDGDGFPVALLTASRAAAIDTG